MPATSVSNELVKTFAQLSKDEQMSVLQMVKVFIQNKSVAQKQQTIEEYNKEIKAALRRAKRGETTSIEKLEEEMKAW